MQLAFHLCCCAAYCVSAPLSYGNAQDGGMEDAHAQRISEVQGKPLPKKRHHEGRNAQFSLGGRQIRFDDSRDFPKLVDDDGLALHYFGKNEVVRDFVASDSGSCLLLLVMTESPLGLLPGFGYHYSYLLRLLAEPGRKIKVTRVMDASLPPMNVLHRNMVELGGVSDGGQSALVKFGEANQEANPYSMSFSWQYWDLKTPKLLRAGEDPGAAGSRPAHSPDIEPHSRAGETKP